MNTEKKYKFIIIDDHRYTRHGVISYIKAHEAFEFIGEFEDTRSVINSNFSGRPDIIILDLNLNGVDAAKAFPMLKQKFPQCKIVAFTQYEDRQKELEKLGFDGYFVKSQKDSITDVLLDVLEGKKYFNSDDKTSFLYDTNKLNGFDNFLKVKELTPREIEIARYLVRDFSNKEIGETLVIAEGTVETHRKHIKEKLGVKTKRELYTILKKYLS